MPSVSHSEVDSYLLCRRKHYYGYGLSLQRITESNSLAMGSMGHKVLQAYYDVILAAGDDKKLQKASMPAALVEAREKYDELIKANPIDNQPSSKLDLETLLFDYYFPNEPLVSSGWRILAVEMEFNLEYDEETHATYPFVVDVIALDPEGKTVVVDHKFVYDFYSLESSVLQPQIPKYIGALRALNFKIDYGLYNMIRTRKQKTMTKDTQLQTLDLHPNATRVQTTFLEQVGAASEVQGRKLLSLEEQSKTAYRVANKMVCQSCSFKDLCETELIGGNVKLMIASEFKVRERKVFAEVSEDA